MKKSDKTQKTKPTDSGRETRVLLEEIRHNLKTVAEGHSVLTEKLESRDEKLSEIGNIVRKIDSNYFKLQMDTESIKSQAGTLNIKADRIEKELETVKNAVMETSHDTEDLKKRIKRVEEKVSV